MSQPVRAVSAGVGGMARWRSAGRGRRQDCSRVLMRAGLAHFHFIYIYMYYLYTGLYFVMVLTSDFKLKR